MYGAIDPVSQGKTQRLNSESTSEKASGTATIPGASRHYDFLGAHEVSSTPREQTCQLLQRIG